jgi:putative hydrolase of the HAD superfamily
MTAIDAVIVDLGGVVAREPTREAFARVQALCGLSGGGFEELWYRHRLPYDRGDLTAAEYWRLVGVAVGAPLDEILEADAAAWSQCEPALVDWLPALRAAGLRTALLSNMPREQWSGLAPHFPWLEHCDEVTLSFELRTAKPDERMYRHCLERLGVEPQRAVFVDDRSENVDAARALGMHAFRYTGVAALRSDLADLVPLP